MNLIHGNEPCLLLVAKGCSGAHLPADGRREMPVVAELQKCRNKLPRLCRQRCWGLGEAAAYS